MEGPEELFGNHEALLEVPEVRLRCGQLGTHQVCVAAECYDVDQARSLRSFQTCLLKAIQYVLFVLDEFAKNKRKITVEPVCDQDLREILGYLCLS